MIEVSKPRVSKKRENFAKFHFNFLCKPAASSRSASHITQSRFVLFFNATLVRYLCKRFATPALRREHNLKPIIIFALFAVNFMVYFFGVLNTYVGKEHFCL
jgi:hypothetical protein